MTYTSRIDLPWWSDPDYTESGVRMSHPLPADYEPEPIIPCCVCEDVPVPHRGRACDGCMNSEHDEVREMAVQANAEVAHG